MCGLVPSLKEKNVIFSSKLAHDILYWEETSSSSNFKVQNMLQDFGGSLLVHWFKEPFGSVLLEILENCIAFLK